MATYFKFTRNGIEFSGFQDIRAKLKEDWNNTFGVELDYSETSPDGHHIDLEAKTINSVAEMIQGICANLNRSTATGQYLEFLAAFLGIRRLSVNGEPESDESLRKRMDEANSRGLATYNGMLSYLQNFISPLVGLSVNDEGETDADGVPGHSLRVTIPNDVTFSADEIASRIWACKPGGIGTSGDERGTAVDAALKPHEVHFARPKSVNVYVSVTITQYSEEAFPSDGENIVKVKIAEWCSNNLSPGKDVLPMRLFVPILEVPGVESAAILLKKENGEFNPDPIRITSEETAEVPLRNIEVNVAAG
ncbi:MAG: hypothetical protein MJY89_06090 [Bacteroidales bacterium]|nr:hypothetical protein [Bacteroidales bacterium]